MNRRDFLKLIGLLPLSVIPAWNKEITDNSQMMVAWDVEKNKISVTKNFLSSSPLWEDITGNLVGHEILEMGVLQQYPNTMWARMDDGIYYSDSGPEWIRI